MSLQKLPAFLAQPTDALVDALLSEADEPEFDAIYSATIDDTNAFPRLSDYQKASIFYCQRRLLEADHFLSRAMGGPSAAMALRKAYIVACERHDLKKALSFLVRLEKETENCDKSLLIQFAIIYALSANQNVQAQKLARDLLPDLNVMHSFSSIIAQVALRIDDGALLIPVLQGSFGQSVLSAIGGRQQGQCKSIVRRVLIEILKQVVERKK